jgi:hypothetical protein
MYRDRDDLHRSTADKIAMACESQCGRPRVANYFVLRQALLASSKCLFTIAERENRFYTLLRTWAANGAAMLKFAERERAYGLHNLWLCQTSALKSLLALPSHHSSCRAFGKSRLSRRVLEGDMSCVFFVDFW